MKKKLLFMLLCPFVLLAQNTSYQFEIDLNKVKNDQIEVSLNAPKLNTKSTVYYLPKTVPGTYSTDNYGRYISNLQAFDKNGRKLKVSRLNDNAWRIKKANRIHHLTYTVNDSFDDTAGGEAIFEPAGSNIQVDTNYVINTHCFLGYFEGLKQLPYELQINHSSAMTGVTAMEDQDPSATKDVFKTENYNRIVDSPIMYAKPNMSTIKIGDSEVVIGVYSPNNVLSADYLAEKIKTLLDAQIAYIGGMPVKKYAFIIYLTDKPGISGSQGALEHSYSSFYYLPEIVGDEAVQFVMDVSAHEFFHILTPLNMHSEEIHYFDFNDPKMSKHLWLYEGSTEYHAHLAQVRYGLTTQEQFLEKMQEKIANSLRRYNDELPFTEMSENVLKEEYKDEYGNVYEKGALISMCIDIMLRKNSDGKYGMINLVNDLSNKYGKDKPFVDDSLFSEIEKIAGKDVRQFLDQYVAGKDPLPLQEILAEVGIESLDVKETGDSTFSLGSIALNVNKDVKVFIADASRMNDFGQQMAYQKDDVFEEINGMQVNARNFGQVLDELNEIAKPGDIFTAKVTRNGELITLSAPMQRVAIKKYNVLEPAENPTQAQKDLRQAWLKAK